METDGKGRCYAYSCNVLYCLPTEIQRILSFHIHYGKLQEIRVSGKVAKWTVISRDLLLSTRSFIFHYEPLNAWQRLAISHKYPIVDWASSLRCLPLNTGYVLLESKNLRNGLPHITSFCGSSCRHVASGKSRCRLLTRPDIASDTDYPD